MSYAQNKPFIIDVSIDAITKKEYYLPIEDLTVFNKERTKNFKVTPHLSKEVDGIVLKNLIVISNVGGSCVEKCTLYILLENEDLITLDSWNKFNCKKTSYFEIKNEDLLKLEKYKISLIRFKNGTDSSECDSYSLQNNDFFQRIITNSVIREKK
jgi:hypothetical protein